MTFETKHFSFSMVVLAAWIFLLQVPSLKAQTTAAIQAPAFTTIDPTSGVRSTTVHVTLTGNGFDEGLSVEAGDGIRIENVSITNSTTATADFVIAGNASLGGHLVKLRNGGGVSEDRVFLVLPPPPELNGITPSWGNLGANVSVTLSGSNFVSGMTVNAGTGISVRGVSILTPATATATFSIDVTAALGLREISVTTTGGTTGTVLFDVLPPPAPVLTSLTPPVGVPNSNMTVTLSGNHFLSGLTVNEIEGITSSIAQVANATTATVSFSIAADAVLGSRQVTVTTVGGTSGAVPFTIALVPPGLASIEPLSSIPGGTANVVLTGTNFTPALLIDPMLGITVSNIAVTNSNTATATFTIDAAATVGPRDVRVATAGGISGAVTFMVNPPAPTLTAIEPASGLAGTSAQVTFTGTNFFAPLSVDAGTDVVASAITLVDSTSATATLTIGLNAAPGPRNVSVTTPGGTATASLFSVTPLPPTLTAISPASVVQAQLARSIPVTLTGTNLYFPTVSVSGTGIIATPLNVTSGTEGTSMFTIDANAPVGPRDVTITTTGGTSMAVTFTVLPPAATLASVTPTVGVRGTSVNVVLTGTNFSTGATLNSISGVTVSNIVVVNALTMTATLNIASGASIGPRSVTVTTGLGTTEPLTFVVADPFPDLSISSSHSGNFGVGFNESYSVVVTNVGSATTTGATIVTDTLPPGFTFVSGVGAGWSCSASGQTVVCQNSATIASGASSAYTLTVAVGAGSSETVNHTVSVATAGDLNNPNNTATDPTRVLATPSPVFVVNPFPVVAGEQASVSVAIARAFPHDITGSISLAFASSAAIPVDDPAIQFATGGRSATFTIPAGSTQARFGSSSDTGPLSFQTGTVAGRLLFSGSFTAGAVQGNFAPAPGVNTPTVASQAPVIRSVEAVADGSGLIASVLFFSTSREVTQLALTFDTTPGVKLNCGSVAGCSFSGNMITFDVSSLFAAWFAGDNTFGGAGLLRLPLSIRGGQLRGTVRVTLGNKQGSSVAVPFTLP